MASPRRAPRRFHQPRRRRAEAASVVREAEAASRATSAASRAARPSPPRQPSSMPPSPPAAPLATACVPTRCPSRSWASVERGPPPTLVILSQLQIVALAMHPHCDMPDPGPRVEPGPERVERAIVRGHGAPGEAECRDEEPSTLIEHGLVDHLVRPQEQRSWDCEPQRFGGLHVDDQLELPGLLNGKISGLRALQDLVDIHCGAPGQFARVFPVLEKSPRLRKARRPGNRG